MRLLACTVVVAVVSAGCGGDSFGSANGHPGSGGTGQTGGAPSNGGASSGGASAGGNTGNGGTASGGVTGSGGTGSGGVTGNGGTGSGGVTGNGGTSSGGAGTGGGSSTCDPLPAVPTDVYVDHASTATSPTGTSSCPFPTIRQGIAAVVGVAGPVTIHVTGGSPQVVYAETGPVLVGANRTLLGDGPAFTKITASGACGTAAINCAVGVDAGGVVAGFNVTCPSGNGFVTSNLTPAPVIRNSRAEGSSANGVLAAGAVDLGPNFSANGNTSNGVQSPATASGEIHVIGTANAFDDNKGNGINIDGAATLTFEGGTASRDFQGIRFGNLTSAGAGPHSIVSLTAEANLGPGGVVCYNGPVVKIRSSSFLANKGAGLLYSYATAGSATLDIGNDPTSTGGGNVFGGATAGSNNIISGIRLCNAGGDATLPAYGNVWTNCPPTQTPTACDTPVTAYADVIYGTTAVIVTGPVVGAPCTVGP